MKHHSISTLLSIAMSLAVSTGWSAENCPARSERQDSIVYSVCHSIAAGDPQVRFYSESSRYLFPSQTVMTVKGLIRAQDNKQFLFENEMEIPNAVIRVQYPHRPINVTTASFDSLHPDRKQVETFLTYNSQLTFGRITLSKVKTTSERLQGYTIIAHKYSNPYVLPEQKLLPFNAWDIKCEIIEGEVPVIAACSLDSDPHSPSCECTYQIKN